MLTKERFAMNDAQQYRVVVNSEEQYSIWPSFREVPLGWSAVGVEGSEQDCLAYIERVWVDLTPKSLRTTGAMPDR